MCLSRCVLHGLVLKHDFKCEMRYGYYYMSKSCWEIFYIPRILVKLFDQAVKLKMSNIFNFA